VVLIAIGLIVYILFNFLPFSVLQDISFLGNFGFGIGFLLYAIGGAWGLWIIGSDYNNDIVKIGAILTIISIPIISQLVLYFGVGDIIKKLSKS
jgi:hypothetical protein